MICVKCFHSGTKVINSRQHKKQASVWRRRRCVQCDFVFTTHERPAIEDYIRIDDRPFSIPRLALSISQVLPADQEPADTGYWLAQTIGEQLLAQQRSATTVVDLVKIATDSISRFDPTAGMHYGLRYGSISPSAKPRRGRPTLTRHP